MKYILLVTLLVGTFEAGALAEGFQPTKVFAAVDYFCDYRGPDKPPCSPEVKSAQTKEAIRRYEKEAARLCYDKVSRKVLVKEPYELKVREALTIYRPIFTGTDMTGANLRIIVKSECLQAGRQK